MMAEADMMTLTEKAEVLIEALPWIERFSGKTVVIKYGGHCMSDPGLNEKAMKDIVLMRYVGINPILVHGGGPEITALLERLGKESAFVDGLRVTDAETAEIAEMVLAGKINKGLVAALQRQGGKAVGLSGKDGGLFLAERHRHRDRQGTWHDLGYVGDVVRVDPSLIRAVVAAGYIPVICSTAADAEGATYNINADAVAGELAAALGACKLILVTDVDGIRRDVADPGSLVSVIDEAQARRWIEEGRIAAGMIPKVEACLAALRGGVPEAHIINGGKPHSLLLEIFTDRGIGTMVVEEVGR